MTGLEMFLGFTTLLFILTTGKAVQMNNRHVEMYRELESITDNMAEVLEGSDG